ncbi:glycoside hydrolase family 65 protein [Enemella evansiae]|uniref:glycoside hydrolase family 65 protein n=1 Tax=Enemella evansiae TaxID=2016499 RepID=UPI001E5D297D|nr:glycosyl hydrolase family 65 protein [Enemella evansiae]
MTEDFEPSLVAADLPEPPMEAAVRRPNGAPEAGRVNADPWNFEPSTEPEQGPSDAPPQAEDPLDRTRFPIDEWRLVETDYGPADLGTTETLFSVANGYLGMRGNPEEGRDAHTHGTFVNGFHETWQIRHAEDAHGFARVGQTIVNVPDTKVMKVYVDDEPLNLASADLDEYERSLDFKTGVLRRKVIWRTSAGKRVQINTTRMVSFAQRHLAIMTMDITMLDGDAPIVISSQVLNRQDGHDEYSGVTRSTGAAGGNDPRKQESLDRRVLDPVSQSAGDGRITLGYRTHESRMTLAVGVDHSMFTDNDYSEQISAEPDSGKLVYRINAREGTPIHLEKLVAYHTSQSVPVRELIDRCRRTLDRAREQGVESIHDDQRAWLNEFWRSADVELPKQPALQQAVRWNLFQLAQASARAEAQGIAAKGVTGTGYSGHYFWDTEIYVLPFLTYAQPQAARMALRFRYAMLDAARQRAEEMAQLGALFPWRTISGEEASAYYAAGTAQYHIDADIAYALVKYVNATGDLDFLLHEGVEILVETARLWADLGFWRTNGTSEFHIHSVTGPDEYTTVVNDNLFTNVMARFNLAHAAETVTELKQLNPEAYARVAKRLSLRDNEVEEWARCAEGMYIPFDESLGVHPQDMHFLEREVWDLEHTPAEKRPLMLHYHPLVLYRFQVLKQADVVLALFLQGEHFTAEEKRADFEYYDPITTGDSTLSAVVQSIMAAETGYHDLALRYFYAGLFVDLDDRHGNTTDGVHVASAGGVWSALVYGFGGMRDTGGELTFEPRLPESWPELRFRLRWRETRLLVTLRRDEIRFEILSGPAMQVRVGEQQVDIEPDEVCRVPLSGQGERRRGEIGPGPLVGGRRQDGSLITASVPRPRDQ